MGEVKCDKRKFSHLVVDSGSRRAQLTFQDNQLAPYNYIIYFGVGIQHGHKRYCEFCKLFQTLRDLNLRNYNTLYKKNLSIHMYLRDVQI